MRMIEQSTVERFWQKVEVSGAAACWEWRAAKSREGYGRFLFQGSNRLAHRVAFTLIRGNIGHGLTLDHICRNRACVNPMHLEAVPHSENMKRMVEARTHCINGHEYSKDNTFYSGHGVRHCRACQRASWYSRNERVNARRRTGRPIGRPRNAT